jgi:hypothetical protein
LSLWSQAGADLQLDAVLAARFKTSNLNRILPLRRISVTRAVEVSGVNNFYFRLNELRDFSSLNNLNDACISLLDGEWSAQAEANPLMFYTAADLTDMKWSASTAEATSWARLVDLIVAETQVPLHEDLKRATFVRLSLPEDRSTGLKPTCLYTDPQRGKVYGVALAEGHSYSLFVTHRIPKGDFGETRPTLELAYENPNKNLELSQPVSEVIGFQQATPIGLSAVSATATWEDFTVKGFILNPKVSGGEQSVLRNEAFVLPIPVKIKPNWSYRFRSRWLWNLVLFLALAVQGAAGFLKEQLSSFLQGTTTLFDLIHYWPVWVVVLVSSAAATAAVTGIQARSKPK